VGHALPRHNPFAMLATPRKEQPMKTLIWVVAIFGGLTVVSVVLIGISKNQRSQLRAQRSNETAAANDARIDRCEAWIGMTERELIQSWGEPERRNTTSTARGDRFQLVYEFKWQYGTDAKTGKTDYSSGKYVNSSFQSLPRCAKDSLPRNAYVYTEGGVVHSIQRRE
ncbi:MAG TPA: hypothetical protein VEK15_08165, partial [Vicinamibacteria bacterium]|nr:hypothetical protein [Vicinamibacteria bacterium]